MGERECHEWSDGIWTCIKGDGDMVLFADFCPACGVKLNSDGTTTERVDAVTTDAVRGTRLWEVLIGIGDDWQVITRTHLWLLHRGYVEAGLLETQVEPMTPGGDCVLWARRTSQARTILAALQQAPADDPTGAELSRELAEVSGCIAKRSGEVEPPAETSAEWFSRELDRLRRDPRFVLDQAVLEVASWLKRLRAIIAKEATDAQAEAT